MIKILSILIISGWATQLLASDSRIFGAAIELNESVTLAVGVEKFEKDTHDGKILISGEIKQVCQKKGCWMMLVEDDLAIRVTFADYGYFVTKDLAGQSILAEGHFERKTLTQRQIRHFLRDEGRSRKEIREARGSQEVIEFVADGVRLLP